MLSCILCEKETCYVVNLCEKCRRIKHLISVYDTRVYEVLDNVLVRDERAIKAKGMKKLFNTSGVQYRSLKIKEKIGIMTETQALDLLSSNGRLVKRPIAVDENRITVGFDESEYKEVWSQD